MPPKLRAPLLLLGIAAAFHFIPTSLLKSDSQIERSKATQARTVQDLIDASNK